MLKVYLIILKTIVKDFQTENKNLLELANKVFFLEEGNFKTVRISAVTDFLKMVLGDKSKGFIQFKNKFLYQKLMLTRFQILEKNS